MKKKYLFLFILILPFFFTSCKKKGKVEVVDKGHFVNSCTAPFSVEFFLDITYQPSEISTTWDFGDGTNSNDKEPVHIYTEPGVYTVKLLIENYQTVVEETMIVNINSDTVDIVSNFDYEAIFNMVAPTEIQFNNYSNYATSYFWDFGDGKGSVDISPTHIYYTAGTQRVVLSSICAGDTTKSVYDVVIEEPPQSLYIDEVVIWLSTGIGHQFSLEYHYGIFEESPSGLGLIAPSDFPMNWVIGEKLFFFDGNYDNEVISFDIWDETTNTRVYSFQTTTNKLATQHYPEVFVWDDGSGYAAEVYFSYQ